MSDAPVRYRLSRHLNFLAMEGQVLVAHPFRMTRALLRDEIEQLLLLFRDEALTLEDLGTRVDAERELLATVFDLFRGRSFIVPAHEDEDAALERSYHEAARRVHPDRHQTADPRAIELSVTTSATLNRAFRVLREPVTRGRYWLALHGTPLGKDNNTVPPALAMLVFETQEQLEMLRDRPSESARSAAESARESVATQLDAHLAELTGRYETWDATTDADTLAELKERLSEIAYLKTLLGDVEEALGV